MISAPFIGNTVCILLHASCFMTPLHTTKSCHYVLVFAQDLHLSYCTILKCDGRMCRFIYTNVHLPCFPIHFTSVPHTVAALTVLCLHECSNTLK